jgi:hypothetical protein
MSSKVIIDELEGNSDPTLIRTASKIQITDSAWNAGHIILGNYHIWIDDLNQIRTKDGAPESPEDGEIFSGPRGYSGYSGFSGAGYSGTNIEAFPINSIYLSVSSTNPAISIGYGTWVAFGAGKMIVGYDATDPSFNTVQGTGGAKTLPAHTHAITGHSHLLGPLVYDVGGRSGSESIEGAADGFASGEEIGVYQGTGVSGAGTTGSGSTVSILPPYIVVYMWKRTA